VTYDEEDSGSSARDGWDVPVPAETARPEPYFRGSRRDTTDAPEKRLMLAVLVNAIIQLQSTDSASIIEVEHWIQDRDGGDEPFSFANVCEVLDIESGYLRRGLLAWRDRSADAARSQCVRHIRIGQAPITRSPERPGTDDRRPRRRSRPLLLEQE
jgi:hypothetical protein